ADAERAFTRALALGDAVGDRGHAISNRLSLSAVDRQSGRPEQAVARAQEALRLAEAMGGRELQRRSLEELAAALEAAGRPREALEAYRRFKAVSDEILDGGKARRIAGGEKRFEGEKRERERGRLVGGKGVGGGGVSVRRGRGGFGVQRGGGESARTGERRSATAPPTGRRNRRYVYQTIGADVAASLRRHRDSAAGGPPPKDGD